MRVYTLMLVGDCYIEAIDQDIDPAALGDRFPWYGDPDPGDDWRLGTALIEAGKTWGPGLHPFGKSGEQRYFLHVGEVKTDD